MIFEKLSTQTCISEGELANFTARPIKVAENLVFSVILCPANASYRSNNIVSYCLRYVVKYRMPNHHESPKIAELTFAIHRE